MPIENAQNISELNVNWPLGADPVSQGDDHLRMIKDVLFNVLPGNTAPGVFGIDFTLDPYGINVRFANVSEDLRVDRQILGSPQVAVGLAEIDGLTGVFTGPNEGIDAVQRVRAGVYDIQLADTQWDAIEDLQLCGSAFVAFPNVATTMYMGLPQGAGHTTAQGWVAINVYIITNNSVQIADVNTLSVVIFDAGRD